MPAIPVPVDVCVNCKFWRATTASSEWGKCVAHPPVLSSLNPGGMLATEHPTSLFPICHKDAWCGEYKRGF